MIQLTRLNHVPMIVNSDLIETVEITPDTVIGLTNGQKFMVLETAEEVVDRVIQFRKAILGDGCPLKRKAEDPGLRSAAGAGVHGE
jgi:flagellar protein FlbD